MVGHRDEGYIGQEPWLEAMGARISTASVKRAQPIMPLHFANGATRPTWHSLFKIFFPTHYLTHSSSTIRNIIR